MIRQPLPQRRSTLPDLDRRLGFDRLTEPPLSLRREHLIPFFHQ